MYKWFSMKYRAIQENVCELSRPLTMVSVFKEINDKLGSISWWLTLTFNLIPLFNNFQSFNNPQKIYALALTGSQVFNEKEKNKKSTFSNIN